MRSGTSSASVLTPLWTEAWNLGYASAKSLATGQPADFTVKHDGEALQGFIGTEGEHWLDQIARTGLGNNCGPVGDDRPHRGSRAINSAAIQCYRDHGVTHKHLLLSPDACDLCKDAAEDGIIPLDAPFSSGGVLGLSHPRDRCCPAPSSVHAEPPLADLGKSAQAEDESRLAWLLIRARDDDGKWRYLLQQRPDGTWGMPGGNLHVGEDHGPPRSGRPPRRSATSRTCTVKATFHHVDPDGKQVYLYLCDVPYVRPEAQRGHPRGDQGRRRGSAARKSPP